MKRSYPIMVLFAIIGMPLGAVADTFGDFIYVSNSSNITITGYTGTTAFVAIPEIIESLPVTTIDPYAFDSRTNMTDLVVPGSIHSIKYQAFSGCSSLTNIVFEEGVNGLDAPAFDECTSLRNVWLPASAVNAQHFAFDGCANLTNYSISSNNPVYTSIDGIWFSKDHSLLVGCPQGISGRYTVPDGVAIIGNGAFVHCSLLDGVSLPASITEISSSAFVYSGIFGLTIPQSVQIIGERVFYGCARLERVVFLGDEPPEPYEPQWMFYNTLIDTIYYRAGTAWGTSYANILTKRCTATTPDPISHSWILSDFPSVTTDEEYEQAATADQDVDGIPSWEEYVAGTSPTNASDYLSITDMMPLGVVGWSSVASRFYSVYFSIDLNIPWPEEPQCRIRGDGSLQSYTNDLMSGIGFHRIGVELYR